MTNGADMRGSRLHFDKQSMVKTQLSSASHSQSTALTGHFEIYSYSSPTFPGQSFQRQVTIAFQHQLTIFMLLMNQWKMKNCCRHIHVFMTKSP